MNNLDIASFIKDIRYSKENNKHKDIVLVDSDNKKPRLKPQIPTDSEWLELINSLNINQEEIAIDIIVPVYGAPNDTLRCIYSVLKARNTTAYNLIVIEDNGPDNELKRILRNFHDQGFLKLYENKTNLGFVLTCNFGFGVNPDRDVLLLNSDTEVFDGWLDEIISCALNNPLAGTITAMSNNATICSYPVFCEEYPYELELSDSELNKLFQTNNKQKVVEAPTGVGFCMYIRRACLDEIGYLNYDLFGKGYGEENDLCVRANKAGWDNLIATGTFVRHYGGSSFGAEKLEKIKRASKVLKKEHPDYFPSIKNFISEDPVREFRENIDIARINKIVSSSEKVFLFISHNKGGGTEKHIAELAKKLMIENIAVFVLKSNPNNLLELSIANEFPLSNFGVNLSEEKLIDFLMNTINVNYIHFHHLLGFSEQFLEILFGVIQQKNIPYFFTVHDYLSICPRIFLVDDSGIYCGEPDTDTCNQCIKGSPSAKGKTIELWRLQYKNLLQNAESVFVPDLDVKWRISRYYKDLNIVVRPHFNNRNDVYDELLVSFNKEAHFETVKVIGIIGAISSHKGSILLYEVASLAKNNAPNVKFKIIGYTDIDEKLLSLGNIEILGKYDDSTLIENIKKQNIDVIWFPVVCPETYSYTLSAALITQKPIVTFNFGAIGRRLQTYCAENLISINKMLNLDEILYSLVNIQKPTNIYHQQNILYQNILEDYYEIRS